MANPIVEAVDKVNVAFEDFKGDIVDRLEKVEANGDRPAKPDSGYDRDQVEHKEAFLSWVRKPHDGGARRHLDEAQHDLKAINIGTDARGGYALPALIADEIERKITTLNPFRSLCRVMTVGSSDFAHLVSRNNASSGWAAEDGSRSETTTSDFVQKKPTWGELYCFPKVTSEALDDVYFDVAQFLVDEASDAFAAAEANAVVSGDGSAKPTGILNGTPVTTADNASPVRSDSVIQYVAMNSASPQVLGASDLIDLCGAVDSQYLMGEGVGWVFSQATATMIRKLQNTNSDYYLQPSLAEGVPERLLGYPVYTSAAVAAPSADNHFILFGNFRRGYLLVQRQDGIRITVDDNISVPGQVKFYMRSRRGGILLNADAIKTLKFADT